MLNSGGVEISQIDSKTMEVKTMPGLYIIGEALDVSGPTGGYNLQLCWSSARASSNHISETTYLKQKKAFPAENSKEGLFLSSYFISLLRNQREVIRAFCP